MTSVRQPTLRDVAEAAGVHTATASRALNPTTRAMVSPDTARRVQKAAESLGYQPNPIARSLKTARSTTIGVVIPDITNPIFPPILRGIERTLEGEGYTALLVNTDSDEVRERGQVESLRARQVDGLIVATARRNHPLMAELTAAHFPVVLVNRRTDDVPMPFVVADDEAGMRMLVQHLVDLGHEKIAHITGPHDTTTGVARSRAFRAAMQEAGLEVPRSRVVEARRWTEQAGAESLEKLLTTDPDITAVVGGNDLIALGCYDVVRERGMRCPRDLSITGFNGMPFLDKLAPPLTTVEVPHFDIGVEAARMLFDCLREPGRTPRSVVLPVSLQVRGSTARPKAG